MLEITYRRAYTGFNEATQMVFQGMSHDRGGLRAAVSLDQRHITVSAAEFGCPNHRQGIGKVA